MFCTKWLDSGDDTKSFFYIYTINMAYMKTGSMKMGCMKMFPVKYSSLSNWEVGNELVRHVDISTNCMPNAMRPLFSTWRTNVGWGCRDSFIWNWSWSPVCKITMFLIPKCFNSKGPSAFLPTNESSRSRVRFANWEIIILIFLRE